MATFKSFEAMGAHIKEKEAEENQKRFKEIFEDKFETFSGGNFKSVLPNVESISITKPLPSKDGKIDNLWITPLYKKADKSYLYHRTLFSLDRNGELRTVDKIPSELKSITKNQFYKEILDITEAINLNFFESVNDEILPSDDWLKNKIKKQENIKEPIEKRESIDPNRIKLMNNHQKVLFGINGINSGFKGYFGWFFPTFLVLENENIGNAAYFFDFKEPIQIDSNRFKLPPAQRVLKKERQEIIHKYWEPIANLTKYEALEEGAVRIWHPRIDDKEWWSKMETELNQKL